MAGECILVIDDSNEIQEVLRTMVIEPNGYRMMSATNGEDGLRLALESPPDLIILDERMPHMTGVEVLTRLREEGMQTPVIFYTFHGSEDLVVQVFRLGVQDYVIKPFEPAEMQRSVERVLEKSRLRDERDRLVVQLQQANERLERQIQEMRTLYSIGRSVTSLLDLSAVLTRVVEAAVFVTRAEEGLLLLKEEQSNTLVLRAAKNLEERVARGLRLLVDDSLAGEVVHSGRPVMINGQQAKVATGYLVNALVYVPIRSPDRGIIGVLGVTNRHSQQNFSEHDVQLLATLSDYAAVALENARLYERAETERRKLETVLHESSEAVVVMDPDQRILLCNPAACGTLQLPANSVGRLAGEVITQPTLQEILRGVQRAKRMIRAEVAIYDGRTFTAYLSSVEGVGYLLMMQDVTHFKELDRIKSEFVSTVSHDLRTPLTTIQGYITLLQRVGPLNEQQQEFVQRVHTSVSEITELIGELLDLGRIEAGYDLDMEPLHVEAVIDIVVDELQHLAAEKNLELRWQKPNLPLIRGNHRRLQQVMENLVSNAIKYTPEGGWIAVEATSDKTYIVVRVADSGIGIPLADQPYIFERFYRVESEETETIQGTGLGLTIVKSAVEKHGGRIWVESRPGVGSVFTFVLPAIE
ncbi:MAG: response regulator [Anaerolineae bacterium]|nr:response regulator [Anaerolineae bacterium]